MRAPPESNRQNKRLRLSRRARLLGSVVLAVVALVVWRFVAPPAKQAPREPVDAHPAPIDTPQPAATPDPVSPLPGHPDPNLNGSTNPTSAQAVVEPGALNERTLPGTKWEREGFALKFGAGGKLLIGGRERARWRVEGSRIRLYRDSTGEEHRLEIAGDKLLWEGQEISRVR